MARELLERLGIVIASVAVALLLSCALASPPTGTPVGVDQRTDATQITVQAAPDSAVRIGSGSAPADGGQPP